VPFIVVVDMWRGFVAYHNAKIDSVTENYLVLKIEGDQPTLVRRASDRPVPFIIELRFDEATVTPQGRGGGKLVRTIVHVTVRPQRSRDRRRRDILERAQRLAASLKSYLIAQDHDPQAIVEEAIEQAAVCKGRLEAAAEAWKTSV
jgi:hypothetical protein